MESWRSWSCNEEMKNTRFNETQNLPYCSCNSLIFHVYLPLLTTSYQNSYQNVSAANRGPGNRATGLRNSRWYAPHTQYRNASTTASTNTSMLFPDLTDVRCYDEWLNARTCQGKIYWHTKVESTKEPTVCVVPELSAPIREEQSFWWVDDVNDNKSLDKQTANSHHVVEIWVPCMWICEIVR
jgi:hypothetical protein